MTYILAKCGERELDFSTVDSVEEAVVEVVHEDDPLWKISLTQENGSIKLEAYSNVDNNYMWDALLKSI